MRLTSIRYQGLEQAAVVAANGIVPIVDINARFATDWPTQMLELLQGGRGTLLAEQAAGSPALPAGDVRFAPLLRRPSKVIGIGLNYAQHAKDLGAPLPTEPASFLKGWQTIVGPGDEVILPPQSERVTAEAELGLVIGKECRNVSEDDAPGYLAGVCLIIDMTAEDILQRNPRFLTRAKNFDTFLSLGQELITLDEVPDLAALEVTTYKNGRVHRALPIADMTFSPAYLLAFHSQVMTLYPGDIISTGTPGAVVIEDGDVAGCRITGLGALENPVRRPASAS